MEGHGETSRDRTQGAVARTEAMVARGTEENPEAQDVSPTPKGKGNSRSGLPQEMTGTQAKEKTTGVTSVRSPETETEPSQGADRGAAPESRTIGQEIGAPAHRHETGDIAGSHAMVGIADRHVETGIAETGKDEWVQETGHPNGTGVTPGTGQGAGPWGAVEIERPEDGIDETRQMGGDLNPPGPRDQPGERRGHQNETGAFAVMGRGTRPNRASGIRGRRRQSVTTARRGD